MSSEPTADEKWFTFIAPFEAKKGQIWVCQACGKTAQNKFKLPDTSCWTWSVLCYKKRMPDGKFRAVLQSV